MPKNKTHKGLLKRVRVTASGKIKLSRAWGRHLRSHKSGQKLRQYRLPKYARGPDARRLRRLLYLKVSGGPVKPEVGKPAAEAPTEN